MHKKQLQSAQKRLVAFSVLGLFIVVTLVFSFTPPSAQTTTDTGSVDLYALPNKTVFRPDGTVDVTYRAVNSTSRALTNAQINESLPPELRTVDGKTNFSLTIGDLPANQSIEKTVTLKWPRS